jgi:hypothetical protein
MVVVYTGGQYGEEEWFAECVAFLRRGDRRYVSADLSGQIPRRGGTSLQN